jgi:hypothetical protein
MFVIYPYKRSKWPKNAAAIHDSANQIEFAMPDIDIAEFVESIEAKETPGNVALMCRSTYQEDAGKIIDIIQYSDYYEERLRWTTAGTIAKDILNVLEAHRQPQEEAFWNQKEMKRLKRLSPSTPVIVFHGGWDCHRRSG